MTTNENPTPDPLDYSEDLAQSTEYLRLTLPLLNKHKLAPNPLNYTLWYEYVSGCNLALHQALDGLLSERGAVPAETSRELYRRYVWDDDKRALEDYRTELRRVLVETLSGVGEAAGQAAQSSETMGRCSQQLQGVTDLDEVRRIVADVVGETGEVARRGEQLKDMLSQTKAEVESLRQALEQTRQEAKTDALTGVLNRRAFDQVLSESIEASIQAQDDLCLVIADIDHFKRVNDNYGHLVGDKVIRFIASQLSANVKGKDSVARIGGEEFAVILPNTRLQDAVGLTDSIRCLIEKSRLKRTDTGEPLGQITVSAGVSSLKPGEEAEAFVRRADEALYSAKNNGRNRVCASS